MIESEVFTMSIYIKVGSVTNAQRAKSILQRNGVRSYMQRLENPAPGDGCGYVLRVEDRRENAVELLQRNGIKILGVERL